MRRDVHLSAKPESYSNPNSRHIGMNKIFLKSVKISGYSVYSILLKKKIVKKSLHCHTMIVSATDNLNGEETSLYFAQNVQVVRSLPVPSQRRRMPRMSSEKRRVCCCVIMGFSSLNFASARERRRSSEVFFR